MRHSLVPLQETAKWEQALKGLTHAFGHTWRNCHAMSLSTRDPTYLYCGEAADERVVCPLILRKYHYFVDVATPFGFSGFAGAKSPGFAREWKNFAQDQGWVCGYIGLHPFLGLKIDYDDGDVFVDNEIFILDLSQSESQLYDRLSRCRQRQIRAWNARGEWLCLDRNKLEDFVLSSSKSFFSSRGASATYNLSSDTWRYLLGLPEVRALGAVMADRVVAVTIFAQTCSMADALFNVSLPEGRDAATSLMWEGALRLRSEGAQTLNMGGGIRQGDSVATAKRRFGAQVFPLRCLKQVYDVDRFTVLCEEAGVDPRNRASYYPPYRSPGVM